MKTTRALALLLLAFALLPRVLAQTNAPDVKAFVHDFYSVYNAPGAVKMADFYAEDATFYDPSFELDMHGRAEIGALFVRGLAKYESLTHEIVRTTALGDDLVVEAVMVGVLHGKTVRVPYVSIFHFVGGKIARQRDMFDTLHFMVQLGVFPSPFQPKPAARPAEAKSN
ncbi:MAG: nuclear transport factor 2 family protein [bacterium]|nr:nuclear transport factor 2 family protein [bacterium]